MKNDANRENQRLMVGMKSLWHNGINNVFPVAIVSSVELLILYKYL